MTVVFHVDDLKVSHKSNKAITKVIEYLDGIYPGLKAVCGDVHEYLGMRIYSRSEMIKMEDPHMKNNLYNSITSWHNVFSLVDKYVGI